MHIQEGVLSGSTAGVIVLGAGFALTAAGTAIGLRKLDYERVPRVALLSAAFFVASFIHVPIGPASLHLVLNGLVGLILGWAAFPALLIALLLQAIIFHFGGLTTLGLNTLNMALPAVICGGMFQRLARSRFDAAAFAAGVAAGAGAVVLSTLLLVGSLTIAEAKFQTVAAVVAVPNLLLAVVEGLVSGSAVLFLRKVCPELLQTPLAAECEPELSHA